MNGVSETNGLEPNGRDSNLEHQEMMPGDLLGNENQKYIRLMEALSKLRDLGIEQEYTLPQIIVCGETSVGKSSVLESIIQIPFPRSHQLCTRYVTQVTIKPGSRRSIRVRIQPDLSRPQNELLKLRAFSKYHDGPNYAEGLSNLMRKADTEILSGSSTSNRIVKDKLLIEVCSPQSPHLTLLDLPGLISNDQSDSGAIKATEDLVSQYMAMPQSIILAVITATTHLNNQKVLELIKQHDPSSERTLGILTRPDLAEERSKQEWVKIIQEDDETFRFKYGWHVVRNRTTEELDNQTPQEDRDQKEKQELSQHPWKSVLKKNLGIRRLRARLCDMLFSRAEPEIIKLRSTLQTRLTEVTEELNDLNGNQLPDDELLEVFRETAKRLRDKTLGYAKGEEEPDGLKLSRFSRSGPLFLRSRVIEQDDHFRDIMIKYGHAWETTIKLSPLHPDDDVGSIKPLDANPAAIKWLPKPRIPKNRDTEVADTVKMLNESRDISMPGFYTAHRINSLFWELSEPWNQIAREHISSIHLCCKQYFKVITPISFAKSDRISAKGFRNSKKVASLFIKEHINTELDKCRNNALHELQKLEEDREGFAKNGIIQFLRDLRDHVQGRQFQSVMQAFDDNQHNTKSSHLDKSIYAKRANFWKQEHEAKVTAEKFLAALDSHYRVSLNIICNSPWGCSALFGFY